MRPKPIDDILINPHMGFTTFMKFNGDPVEKRGLASRFGPDTFHCADDPPAGSRDARPDPHQRLLPL